MSRKSLFTSLSFLLFILSAVYVAYSLIRPDTTNVLIVTVESLRNDMISNKTTPHLLKAAENGYRFTEHRSVSGWTGANIVSILTGLDPFETGVHTRGQSLEENEATALEELSRQGYSVLSTQGFATMEIYKNLGLEVQPQSSGFFYHLAQLKNQGSPFFTWYHYLDTHLPYSSTDGNVNGSTTKKQQLNSEQRRRLQLVAESGAVHFEETVFESGDVELIHKLQAVPIAEFDSWFGDFWDFFHQSGLNRNTIVILTADHGDEHGERGMVGHASTTQLGHLHEEIVRVPLFIWLPQSIYHEDTNTEITTPSSHIDLIPTIFALLDKKTPRPLKGRSLFSHTPPSPWLAMTSSGGFSEPDPENIRYFEYSVIEDCWKLRLRIDNNGAESFWLYNLATDPGENTNLFEQQADQAIKLHALLKNRIASKTVRPVTKGSSGSTRFVRPGAVPVWQYPAPRQWFHYDDMQGLFQLRWSGDEQTNYLIEYVAGTGKKEIHGFLEVTGTIKDFGNISRKYWNSWVVNYSPFKIRVKEEGAAEWSQWLTINVKP